MNYIITYHKNVVHNLLAASQLLISGAVSVCLFISGNENYSYFILVYFVLSLNLLTFSTLLKKYELSRVLHSLLVPLLYIALAFVFVKFYKSQTKITEFYLVFKIAFLVAMVLPLILLQWKKHKLIIAFSYLLSCFAFLLWEFIITTYGLQNIPSWFQDQGNIQIVQILSVVVSLLLTTMGVSHQLLVKQLSIKGNSLEKIVNELKKETLEQNTNLKDSKAQLKQLESRSYAQNEEIIQLNDRINTTEILLTKEQDKKKHFQDEFLLSQNELKQVKNQLEESSNKIQMLKNTLSNSQDKYKKDMLLKLREIKLLKNKVMETKRIPTSQKAVLCLSHKLKTSAETTQLLFEAIPSCKEEEKKNQLIEVLNKKLHMAFIVIRRLSKTLIGKSIKEDLHYQDFNIEEFCRSLIEVQKQWATFKNIALMVDIPKDFATNIYCDRVILYQIIEHLIENAISISKSGSKVLFKLEEIEKYIIFEVMDKAGGIDDHVLKSKTFLDLKKTDVPYLHSGLNITNYYASLIKATLNFKTKKGTGTVFYLQLPKK